MKILNFLLLLAFSAAAINSFALENNPAENPADNQTDNPDKLVVIWTSDDPYVAERVALMYTHAAKTADWFTEVTLIIWGPSAKLAAENLKVQEKLKAMQEDGVEIEACIVCANEYGVTDELRNMDFIVRGMGSPLTDYLKSGAKVLTF
ncbi:MAG: DsrE family protein [Bacteroidales bacterium]